MVKQNKMEMLSIEGGGIIMGLKRVASVFGKIIFRSIFRW